MATMPASTIVPKSHVGFDSITSQIEKKLLKRGFQFNVICVGMFGDPSGDSNGQRAPPTPRRLLHELRSLTFCLLQARPVWASRP